MDGDSPVEVLLGGSHFDGDPEALHHFIHAAPHGVEADDPFIFADNDKFHEGGDFVVSESVEHAVELCLVDLVLAVNLLGLLLVEADHAEGRMCEHDGRDVVVVKTALGLPAEEPVGQLLPGRDGHWGQLHLAGDVAERVESCDVGVLKIVRRYEAVFDS